jgi:hypothetical protein
MLIFRTDLPRMRNFSHTFLEKMKYKLMPFYKNRAVYEMAWKIIVEHVRPQMTIWSTRIACWMTKFFFQCPQCPLWTSWSPLPVVAEV